MISPYCPWCPTGILWPHGDRFGEMFRCASCGRIRVPGAGPPGEYREQPPAEWWQEANVTEVCLFRLSSVNPPDGSGIPGLDSQELRRLLALAQPRLSDRKTCTPWLERYAGQLLAETRARRGVAV